MIGRQLIHEEMCWAAPRSMASLGIPKTADELWPARSSGACASEREQPPLRPVPFRSAAPARSPRAAE